jgi:hypothetical protein
MYKLLSFLLASIPVFCTGQENNEELIHWAENRKLKWSDYKGPADKNVGAAASTATYLGIDYNFSPKGLVYKITCSFSKTKSWGLHKSNYILDHEQAHFDIAEIFARKLNKKMMAYKFDPTTYKTDLRKIYEDVLTEKEELQNRYDEETNHSINKEKQAEWLITVRLLLTELDSYKEYN